MSVSDLLRDAETRMKKSVEAASHDFASLRTGRANPSLVDSIKVDYYGQAMPLPQLATVTVPESRLLLITPYDKSSLGAIEKAITKSDLNLNPANDGQAIRLSIPPLTQERRKDYVKQLANKAEGARVSMRNIRRDAMDRAKKDDEITDDEVKRLEKDMQKLLDKYVAEADALAKAKEVELLEQ
jgi:ribosome recycling factor